MLLVQQQPFENLKKVVLIPFLYLTVIIDLQLNVLVNGMTSAEVEMHLETGKKLLAAGQLADALAQYHSAIDGDPNNYMSYYRRGTVYLAMGKFKSALSDLNRVIELKPDFNAARLQRGNIYFKQGDFEYAIGDYQAAIQLEPGNSEAKLKLEKCYSIINDLGLAKHHQNIRDFPAAIDIYTNILESCPWSTEVHQLRSDCYLNIGDVNKAIFDINALAKLIPDNTDAFYRLSELHYSIGEADLALNDVRECLRLDADHKKCSKMYKKLRKLTKSLDKMKKSHDENRFSECLSEADSVISQDPQSHVFRHKAQSFICSCNTKARESKKAIETCSEVLKQSPNDADALYNRAQAYIIEEDLDKALSDCQKAHEQENSQRTSELMDKINKLIKQSKKRDYYKILGVKRSADKNTILKAYRKLAHKWHPDKYDDSQEKEKAQKVFIDIAAAKEVLTDPEKRAKFDNGEDPLDPEDQQHHGHGFNPFQHGFNPFGGGGFGGGHHFKFKFN
ncbi:unnamed protein product [Brachionus calyciflorus]|uniref:J domain-containing protein n=1 Tax=Brachionus calyciflorus TaxID=104777 RepID=A0A813M3U4_9BILA|nr:unnamed protein product [Brachionus calyciflorus]